MDSEYPPEVHGIHAFYEGAVDLTAFGLDHDSSGEPICINRFVFDTRSSQELGATLFDFASGDVQTCANPSIATNLFRKNAAPPDTSLAPPGDTVTLPADVYDTATISGALGTPTGTVTYSLWTNSTCTVAATAPTDLRRRREHGDSDDRAGRHDPAVTDAHVQQRRQLLVAGGVLRRRPQRASDEQLRQ